MTREEGYAIVRLMDEVRIAHEARRLKQQIEQDLYRWVAEYEKTRRLGWNAPYHDPDALVDSPSPDPYI